MLDGKREKKIFLLILGGILLVVFSSIACLIFAFSTDNLSELPVPAQVRILGEYKIAEDDWKKMDKLEEYINKHTEYNIGNKMWLCLEKYSTVNLACGGDSKTALDMGVSAKLLPSMIVSLSGKMSKEEKSFYEVLDDVFGEDNADRCKTLVKSLGSDLA